MGAGETNMNVAFDIVIVLTIAAAAFTGYRLGIVRAGMAAFGIAAGFATAKYSAPPITPYVGRVFNDPEMAQAVSVMAVVFGVLVVSIVAGALLRRGLKFLLLGWLDSSAGAIAGVALLLVMWTAGLNVVVPNLNDNLAEAVERSHVAGTILRVGPGFLDSAPEFVRDYAEARIPVLGIN
jgi:membrane protein required for colicin V production